MFHQKSIHWKDLFGKNDSFSEKAHKVEEGTISTSKPKVWKVKSDEDDSDFECYNKSDGQPVHVDIDKEGTGGRPALALLPNKSDEKLINSSETRVRTVSLVYTGLTEHLNQRSGWVMYRFFEGNIWYLPDQPEKNHQNPDWWQWRRWTRTNTTIPMTSSKR